MHFANWERAKHRADFFAKIGFPDSHPLRHTIGQLSRDLEAHRVAADQKVAEIARKHGDFCLCVDGHYFERATDWFRSGKEIYWDCPENMQYFGWYPAASGSPPGCVHSCLRCDQRRLQCRFGRGGPLWGW